MNRSSGSPEEARRRAWLIRLRRVSEAADLADLSPIGSSGINMQVGRWKITCNSSEEHMTESGNSYETDM
jgi:hypothetical protein